LYADFGTDVKMTLNPFVFGSASSPRCFDESSPCVLEQTSMCLISIAEQNDKSSTFPGQSAYVPWLVCMDANGDPTSQCDSQVGVSTSAVQQCMKSQASQLLKEYIKVDSPIDATPTVHVNGKQVKTSYSAIRAALCDADPSLKGCSAPVPNDADREVAVEKVPKGVLVV